MFKLTEEYMCYLRKFKMLFLKLCFIQHDERAETKPGGDDFGSKGRRMSPLRYDRTDGN